MKQSLLALVCSALFGVILQVHPAPAQDQWNVDLVGSLYHRWDWPNDIDLSGNYAYLATGLSGLSICDISNPAEPLEVSYIDTLQTVIYYVKVIDHYVYAAGTQPEGIDIVDVSDPLHPIQVGQTDQGEWVGSIHCNGQYAYVNVVPAMVQILDVSDPLQPEEVGSCNLPYIAWDMDFSGNYAYLADWNAGLLLWDISDPTSPVQVGSLSLPYTTCVAVAGKYAYVSTGGLQNGLHVIDINNPANPFEVSFLNLYPASAEAAAISGNYVYLGSSEMTGYGLYVIDVSNPDQPQLVTHYTQVGLCTDIELMGNQIYATSHDKDLQIIDVTTPSNPSETGYYQIPGALQELSVSGNYVYLADGDQGLRIVNVSTPNNPVEAGWFPMPSHALDVAVSGNLAFVANYEKGLRIIDVSDPSNPMQVSIDSTLTVNVIRVDAQESFAYVTGSNTLQIVDASDPNNPVLTGVWVAPAWVADVEVLGNYAYIACTNSGLQIVDISDPDNPTTVGGASIPGEVIDYVAVSGNYACAVGFSGLPAFLHVFDISSPSSPSLVGTTSINYSGPWGLTAAGTLAFVANQLWGVQVYDFSNPSNILHVGYYDTPGRSDGVAVSGNHLYNADWFSLQILDYSDVLATNPFLEPELPDHFAFALPSPNPFNPSTTLSYELPTTSHVSLKVYDTTGRLVTTLVDGRQEAGSHQVTFDGSGLASGPYLAKLTAGDFAAVQKLVLLK